MFEWDEEKNHRNIAKHGIAFGEVLPVFSSQKALVIEDSRKEYGEARFILLCSYEGVHLHVTFTRRDETIRLISAIAPTSGREVIVSDESTTRAILTQDGRVLIEQPDGSYRPARSKTDWDRVPAMTEEDIEAAAKADPDAPPLDDEFWRTVRVVIPPPKKHTGIRIDADVLDWFRRQGRGRKTRMNAVLRAYYEVHRSGPR